MEVMVEGLNPARGQVTGRSSQNKPVNFTCAQPIAPAPGSYARVKITGAFPNSLWAKASKMAARVAEGNSVGHRKGEPWKAN
jgi:tRNA-2-methylthio-N6-dimethylallyladenosine synthase